MSQPAPRLAPIPPLAEALDRAWTDEVLDPAVPDAVWAGALTAPLDEFVRRPGKELRTTLCHAGWSLGAGQGEMPPAVALVIDGLHAGSLIIDDLEDQAEERRGRPAFHRLHGDAAAINSGTWLYFWALERLAEIGGDPATQLHVHRRALAVLRGCHEGQALDLSAKVDQLDGSKLAPVCAAITRGKTAALAGFAMELAALAAGATPAAATAIGGLGATIGTALQMFDDLGALTRARRGKGREDLRARRVTWPWPWLVEVTDALTVARWQHRLRGECSEGELDAVADDLYAAVSAVGRRRIRTEFAAGLDAARAHHGDAPALHGLDALFARMEESYG